MEQEMSNAIFWNDHKKLHEQKTDLAGLHTDSILGVRTDRQILYITENGE